MTNIREAVVAGTFYCEQPKQLSNRVHQYLNEAPIVRKVPRAIIVPHAGYIYSGSIAATAYARLQSAKDQINRVVLIGPSHRVSFKGLALSSATQFATPLGNIELDINTIRQLAEISYISYLDQAHELEHSLEVQLPFLQTILKSFLLVPIVTGDASAENICQIIEQFWEDPKTLIVISSDLSHFHDHKTAEKMDKETTQIIEQNQYEKLNGNLACGYVAISGLLAFARKHRYQIEMIDLRNSADTVGSQNKNRVVGYGSYVIE